MRRGDAFEYREEIDYHDWVCRLRFTADRSAITVEELEDGCRWYCGARATIGRVRFPR
jgi:hypothetical protein